MRGLPNLSVAVVATVLACLTTSAQTGREWRDTSPHKQSFVSLSDGTQLELLDWGGSGRALILLAGFLTAHAYDEIAPKLAHFAHVYGITRRGLGVSSRTQSGYSASQSAADVVAVLDKLKLAAPPVLAGHSFGGQDLTIIASEYPNRIAGIVYLDSAGDPTLELSDYAATPLDAKRLPPSLRNPVAEERRSVSAYREWQSRTHGIAFPESEIRQLYAVKADGALGAYLVPKNVRDALFAGVVKPDFRRIRVPVLAFCALPPGIDVLAAKHRPATADERAALEEKRDFDLAVVRRHICDLKNGVPTARIVELPGASSYVFLSNEAEVIRGIRSFLAELPYGQRAPSSLVP